MQSRINVFIHIITAAILSFLYVPFPETCDGIIHYIVKRIDHIITNGESNCQKFCQCVQPDGEDSRSVVAENDQGDGQDRHDETSESGRDGEFEPIGREDE